MWRCINCETQIEDQHTFCWQCGKKRVLRQELREEPRKESAVPAFESFEQLAPEPASHRLLFRRGFLQRRLLSYALILVLFVIFKILASQFFGTYGLYIFVALAFIALIIILWRFFHRDASEGVGINLH